MQGKDRALVAVGGVLGIAALWYAAPRLYDFLKAKAEAEVKKWVKNALLDLTGSVLPTTAEAAKVTKQLPPAVLEKPKPKADRGTTHCKPGPPLTYADSEAHAAKMGGRLLTLEEAKALMGGRPLYPGEDQWCAVQGRDWVQVGDAIHHPGKSHISECGGYPGWGDDANDCNPWHYVALYTTGGGGASHGGDGVRGGGKGTTR